VPAYPGCPEKRPVNGCSYLLELVDMFCYLREMLSVDGDADAAVKARIQI